MVESQYTNLPSFLYISSELENKKSVYKQIKINESKGRIIHCKLLILRFMKNI